MATLSKIASPTLDKAPSWVHVGDFSPPISLVDVQLLSDPPSGQGIELQRFKPELQECSSKLDGGLVAWLGPVRRAWSDFPGERSTNFNQDLTKFHVPNNAVCKPFPQVQAQFPCDEDVILQTTRTDRGASVKEELVFRWPSSSTSGLTSTAGQCGGSRGDALQANTVVQSSFAGNHGHFDPCSESSQFKLPNFSSIANITTELSGQCRPVEMLPLAPPSVDALNASVPLRWAGDGQENVTERPHLIGCSRESLLETPQQSQGRKDIGIDPMFGSEKRPMGEEPTPVLNVQTSSAKNPCSKGAYRPLRSRRVKSQVSELDSQDSRVKAKRAREGRKEKPERKRCTNGEEATKSREAIRTSKQKLSKTLGRATTHGRPRKSCHRTQQEKREVANAREKLRVKELSERFDRLARLLPVMNGQGVLSISRNSILREAADYIEELERKLKAALTKCQHGEENGSVLLSETSDSRRPASADHSDSALVDRELPVNDCDERQCQMKQDSYSSKIFPSAGSDDQCVTSEEGALDQFSIDTSLYNNIEKDLFEFAQQFLSNVSNFS